MKVNEKKNVFPEMKRFQWSWKVEEKKPEHPAENTKEDKEQDQGEEMKAETDEDEEETTKHSKAEKDEL